MPIPGLPLSDTQLWDVLNGVLPAWALLAVAPRWRHTLPLVTATAAFYSLLYVGALAGSISRERVAGCASGAVQGEARVPGHRGKAVRSRAPRRREPGLPASL